MWCKFSSLFIVLIAIILAIIGSSSALVGEFQTSLSVVAKFFDIMLPVLGVGALLKYLLSCAPGCMCRCCAKKMCAPGCTCGCCQKKKEACHQEGMVAKQGCDDNGPSCTISSDDKSRM